jgi:RNA polymerase sigma factor for flagellar operon FliA
LDEPSSVERLWEEFKLKASADARERLILHYAPLVKYVAGRVSVGCRPTSSRPTSSPTASSA